MHQREILHHGITAATNGFLITDLIELRVWDVTTSSDDFWK